MSGEGRGGERKSEEGGGEEEGKETLARKPPEFENLPRVVISGRAVGRSREISISLPLKTKHATRAARFICQKCGIQCGEMTVVSI